MVAGLFTTITNVNFDTDAVQAQVDAVRAQAKRIAAGGAVADEYDMKTLWSDNEDIRSLKSLILFGLRGVAAYAYHAMVLGYMDDEVNAFFYKALRAIGSDMGMDGLLPLVLETGRVNLSCMEMLDHANTDTYGTPVPTTVPLTVEKGPFIVISGHDLKDLKLLLEQTEGKGINIYTHGEMLPAHAYPKLKAYPHLKGNFGTAWQNQQKEFAEPSGARPLYDELPDAAQGTATATGFTRLKLVAYPGLVHIGDDQKDYSHPPSKKPLELGGYAEDKVMTGINGGTHRS